MTGKVGILLLLLKKNFLVRKKHWTQSIVIQILIPIALFLIGQTVRLMSGNAAEYIDKNTYYEVETKEALLKAVPPLTRLRFTPDVNATAELMEYTRNCLGLLNENVIGSINEETMISELTRDQVSSEDHIDVLGVVFETVVDNTIPNRVKYKVRTSTRIEKALYDPEENGNKATHIQYGAPLVPLQLCLDEAIINRVSNRSSTKPAKYSPMISIQQMPYPPYMSVDKRTTIGGETFAELARFIFLIVLCVEISFPANEKYIGINILMSVNGVSTRMNLFSWLISGAIFSTFYLAPVVLILRHFMPPTVLPFLSYGDPFIVWIVLFVHCWHIIAFGYHLSAYFWKPSHGIFATFMFMVVINNIARFATGATFKHFLLYVGIISPSILLRRMFEEITIYESKLIGVKWSNMFSTGTLDVPGEGCIGVMLIFSIIGIVVNFFMAVYIYAVRPGKYGVSKNPLFCFQNRHKIHNDENKIDFEKTKVTKKEFEDVPEGSLDPGIRIRGLKKIYTTDWLRGTTVYALKGVSMDFYKSQITALLGHNGAGKTTMMSILSGLTNLTEGVVFIDGKNIQQNPETIKNNIGLCPQENMVFPDLTVYQQLLFFGRLKAGSKTKRELEMEIDILLDKVNLTEKRDFIPKQLSGGQKRRLCLAMAVIGDANVLILDEPTSGMDAESKREVWDIVLKMRGEKTIIISTHDMEEADILGDRIAIMHTGRLKSYGTSMFLKKLYGDGQVEVTLSVKPWCDSAKVLQEIGISAQLLNQDEGKMVFAIPLAENLPEALDKLESLKQKLGITGISVSIITLEQVFLRVTREEGDEVDSGNQIKSFQKTTGVAYFLQCFSAFLIKKFAFVRKNPWTFWLSLLLPCLACSMMIMAFGERKPSQTPTLLTLQAYSAPRVFVKSSNTYLGNMYARTIREFMGKAEIVDSNMSVTDALLRVATEDIGVYRNKYIVSAEFNGTGAEMKANGFYSGTAYLGIPITVNAISNALLKALANDENYSIEISAQQLPTTWAISRDEHVDAPMITLAIIVFLAPAVALYATQPLQEMRNGVKQLQSMTGASKLAYWGSMFIFDFVQYTISSFLLLASFILVDISLDTQFYYATEILVFMELLLLFGVSVLPFVYLVGFMKKTLNATLNMLSVTPLVLGFVEMILVAVTLAWDNHIFSGFRKIQSKIFQMFPHLSLTYGHVSFFTVLSRNARCRRMTDELIAVSCIVGDECCERECHNGDCRNPLPYFTEANILPEVPNLATSMGYLAGSFFLFFAVIWLLEQQIIQRVIIKIRKKNVPKVDTTGMDELVVKEKAIVADEINKRLNTIYEDENDNVFLVHELRKNYGKLNVVKGISFRVKEGECFGLLGVNGAGKSTTFRMLTGEELANGGQMWLKSYSIENNRMRYLQEMGYCPQQDAIIDTLNTWDHLYLFARLRGIPKAQVHSVVKKWIAKLNLTACAAQPSGTYSGGNKRRLNIAMSLIGNPSLVLMDEPTTGVDPAARRSLWNTLKTCQDSGQSIILTSHSMEECEVLCNRLVIMVKGQLVCVGASQELKQRFGAGYNIHVKLAPNRNYADVEQIRRKIESSLVCKLTDENSGFLGYHVTDPEATWTLMYNTMNELKNNYDCIEDFAVLSSTLEQLFIQFARAPDDAQQPNGNVPKKWWKKTTRGSPV